MKITSWFLLLIFLAAPVWFFSLFAAEPPNNKFGIHVVQPSDEDLTQMADLVNSSGGDWGYVTLVIQENDRDRNRWQELFDRLRRLHLIPIVRLATSPAGDNWRRPEPGDSAAWADFLDSLNWVVKNRYVVLFNEPNHGKEWGGASDPRHYAETAYAFAQKLKEKNPDFFVMLAGFDAAAPSRPPLYEDEAVFLKKILDFGLLTPINPDLIRVKTSLSGLTFDLIDGWVSHSYPNHGFVGTPYDVGRNSVRTYQWELTLLKELGVDKNLPVFITETGWPHKISPESTPIKSGSKVQSQKSRFYSPEKAAEYIRIAYEKIWLADGRVEAVTPFIFNYQSRPFDIFSWKRPGGGGFYPQYETVQTLPKKRGRPNQEINLTALNDFLPRELLINSTYDFKLEVANRGQAILDKADGYELVGTSDGVVSYLFSDLIDLVPFASQTLDFYVKTGANKGDFQIDLGLMRDKKKVRDLFSWRFNLSGPPSLNLALNFFPKGPADADGLELQIFDDAARLVFRRRGLKVRRGRGLIETVNNVALNQKYRVVILAPYYLPRQNFMVFRKNQNLIDFEPFLPVDFNRDGKLSGSDVWTLVKTPALLRLWWFK